MHHLTPPTTSDLRRLPAAERLGLLRDAYSGARGVVVTCGPSLAEFDSSELQAAVEGSVTFSIKQAIDVVGPQADFQCFNTYNVSKYRVPASDTIRVLCTEPSGKVPQLNRSDLRLPLGAHTGALDESLVGTGDFDSYLLERTPVRPWGPGILHELIFYLAIHLGLSELITVGWDIANDRGNNVHFYDAPAADNFFDRGRADAYRMTGVRRGLPEPVRLGLRWGRTALIHARGGVYNRTTMIPGESEIVGAATGATSSWLAGHGVRLRVVGESRLMDPGVERLSRREFYELPSA